MYVRREGIGAREHHFPYYIPYVIPDTIIQSIMSIRYYRL